MPPAYVKDLGSANSKSSSTTLAITFLGTVPIGNCVLVAVGGLTQSTDIASCADSRGNTYTRLGGQSYDLGVGRLAIFASILTTALQIGDTITATWASAVSTRVAAAVEASGIVSLTLDGGTPRPVEAAASASMSNGPTSTTANANDLLWAMWLVSNATAIFDLTPTDGWTESQGATTGITGTNRSIGTQYRVVAATGAHTATATQDASRAYDGLLVALRGAADAQVVAIGQAAETDAVQALAAAKARALAQVAETDAPQGLAATKAQAVAQAVETEAAQPLAPAKAFTVGQAVETDAVQALVPAKALALGQVLEVETVQSLTAVQTGEQVIPIAQAAELDAVQPLTPAKAAGLGQVAEVEQVGALTASKRLALGQVLEVDAPLSFGRLKRLTLAQATETSAVEALGRLKRAGLGMALEIDTVGALRRGEGVVGFRAADVGAVFAGSIRTGAGAIFQGGS